MNKLPKRKSQHKFIKTNEIFLRLYAGERGKIGLLVEPDKGLQSERIETDTD